MKLEYLIIILIGANAISLTNLSRKNQNLIMFFLSIYFGFDQELTIFWIDGTINVWGHCEGSIIINKDQNINLVDAMINATPNTIENSTQLKIYDKFISIEENIIKLHLDFVNLNVENIRVLVDNYPAQWDGHNGCYYLDLDNVTPRVNNLGSLFEDQFKGVTFEVKTNGLPLKHLKC